MTTLNTTPSSTSGRTARRVRPVRQPSNNFERLAWLFMRYSGLALVFLALSHWGLQHIINSVHDLTLDSTISRWGVVGQPADFAIWFWRAYYVFFLGLGLLHGLNGLRQVAYDYLHIRALYYGFMTLATILILFVTIAGAIALFMGVNVASIAAGR